MVVKTTQRVCKRHVHPPGMHPSVFNDILTATCNAKGLSHCCNCDVFFRYWKSKHPMSIQLNLIPEVSHLQ